MSNINRTDRDILYYAVIYICKQYLYALPTHIYKTILPNSNIYQIIDFLSPVKIYTHTFIECRRFYFQKCSTYVYTFDVITIRKSIF